eukprot:jgi/Galph1/4152/GphlegSOOS_G2805.1
MSERERWYVVQWLLFPGEKTLFGNGGFVWLTLIGTLILWLLLVLVVFSVCSALQKWIHNLVKWVTTPCYRNIPFVGKPKELPWYKFILYGHSGFAATLASPYEIARWFIATKNRLHSDIYSYCFMFLAPRIALMSPEAAKHVMVKNVRNYIKPRMVRQGLANLLGNKGILLAEGDDHARQRRIILPAFHFEALVQLGSIFRQQGRRVVMRWLETMKQEKKEQLAVDVHLDMTEITMNVIAISAFGYDPTTASGRKLYEAYRAIFVQKPPSRILSLFLFLLPNWLLRIFPLSRMVRRQQQHVAFVKKKVTEIVQQRREIYERSEKEKNGKARNKPQDLLDMLVAARDTEQQKQSSNLPYLTDEEITSQALTFMAAGQVTTAVLLSWTLFELSIHPEIQTKLREELRTLYEKETEELVETENRDKDALVVEQLDKLPYLDAVLKESLRLHPPVLFVTRQAAQDDEICGTCISKGAIVNIPIVAHHRDVKEWGLDADVFRPERFLEENNQNFQRHPMSWLPFLYGARACTGQRFALLEAKTVLFEMIPRISIQLSPGCEVKGQGFVSVPHHLSLIIRSMETQ